MKTFLTLACATLTTLAAEWSQFRGPQASGIDASKPLPTNWNLETGENIRWQSPIPGLAHASPIVWRDRVFVLTVIAPGNSELKVGLYGDIESAQDPGEHEWRLRALDLQTGNVLWDKPAHRATPRVKRHPKASHANSTPATDGKRIVAILGSEGLFCFDTRGQLLWKKDLGPMDSGFFRAPTAQWGFASSPIIHDGKVVVQCDVQTNSFLALFDLKTGKELWRAQRKDVPTWSTPAIARVNRKPQILVNGWHHTGGYDFKTGAEIWKLDGGGDIPVPTPILGKGNLAYFTSAHGPARPMRAIRLNAAKGDITPDEIGATNAAIAWVHPRSGNYMQTPILVKNTLYACFDNGILTAFDAATGKIHYSERLAPSGREGFSASPVSDGRHVFFPSENGALYVVKPTHKLEIIATNQFN